MTVHEKDVGSRLRIFRKKNNFSLNDLARKTGIAASNLSSIELSKTSPTLSTLVKIAEAFDLRVGAFLDDVLYEKAHFFSRADDTSWEPIAENALSRRISPDVPQIFLDARILLVKHGSPKIPLDKNDADRLMYCVEEGVSITVDGDVFDLNTGDSVYVLAGAAVTVRSHEGPDARLLVVESLNRLYGAGT